MDRRGSYLHAGDRLHHVILYYKIHWDSAVHVDVRDFRTKFPLKDYAIVARPDRMFCYIALELKEPYTISDPAIFALCGVDPKIQDETPDIFEEIRRFGFPFGSYRYATVSLLGECPVLRPFSGIFNWANPFFALDVPQSDFPPPEKYVITPSYGSPFSYLIHFIF